jgi:hypothetical protein
VSSWTSVLWILAAHIAAVDVLLAAVQVIR